MPTTRTFVDHILIALNDKSEVRGLAAYEVTELVGDDGNILNGAPHPPRDVTAGEAADILAPIIPAQQAQIKDLTAQLAQSKTDAQAAADKAAQDLAASETAKQAALDDAAQKQARIEALESQLATAA